MFRVKKPEGWSSLALFEKIKYYQTVLTADYAPYVDKLDAKDLARTLCPEIRVAPVVRLLSGPDDLHATDANPSHLLKAVHGCGWTRRLSLPLNVEALRSQLGKWMKPYSVVETQYTFIPPRFFIEEILDDAYTGTSGQARVFMVRCIHGVPVSVGVRKDDGGRTMQNSYTPTFGPLASVKFPLEKPAQWDALLRCATQLSAPFEFVRIDLYIGADGHIYLSEFTFTPAGGHRVFPMELEKEQGRLWT